MLIFNGFIRNYFHSNAAREGRSLLHITVKRSVDNMCEREAKRDILLFRSFATYIC